MAMTERHFPKGLPRRRLGQPERCLLTGKMMTGMECLQSGCEHAIEAEAGGFVDCLQDELAIGRNPRPEDRSGAKVVAGVNQ